MAEREGFARQIGPAGARDYVLALPSVVCAGLVAERLAGTGVVALPHQHGCLHVGDDLSHTGDVLTGLAANPNVAATLVVSLGCETLQGRRLVERIVETGRPAALVVIQSVGGTAAATDKGAEAIRGMRSRHAGRARTAVPASDILVGLDASVGDPSDAVVAELDARGMRVERADGQGPQAHTELASAGAQVIVSLPGPDQAPVGFALCPVIAVGSSSELHAALADDFDLLLESGTPVTDLAAAVADKVERVFDGAPAAAERRGSAEFSLRRLAITM